MPWTLFRQREELVSSRGAAAHQASFTTPKGFADRVYEAAFSQQGADPSERTAENSKGILDFLKENNIAKGIGDAVTGGISTSVTRIVDALQNLPQHLGEVLRGALPNMLRDMLPSFPGGGGAGQGSGGSFLSGALPNMLAPGFGGSMAGAGAAVLALPPQGPPQRLEMPRLPRLQVEEPEWNIRRQAGAAAAGAALGAAPALSAAARWIFGS